MPPRSRQLRDRRKTTLNTLIGTMLVAAEYPPMARRVSTNLEMRERRRFSRRFASPGGSWAPASNDATRQEGKTYSRTTSSPGAYQIESLRVPLMVRRFIRHAVPLLLLILLLLPLLLEMDLSDVITRNRLFRRSASISRTRLIYRVCLNRPNSHNRRVAL